MLPAVAAPARARRRSWRRAASALGLALGLSGLAGTAAWAAPGEGGTIGVPQVLHDAAPAAQPAIQRGSYDYAPSVLYDPVARLYRMWWCGGQAGDHVLYAESASLDGPFRSRWDATPNSYDVALGPSSDPTAFDHTHTCDPSVIRVGGTWFMYYGGANELELGAPTRIGLATSTDGHTWTRAHGGKPIVSPVRDPRLAANPYGAGQPSVTHVDGMFHLVFTDTTGHGGNQRNGAGQYVMRSTDPRFVDGVEELQRDGWLPYTKRRHTRHSILEAFSTDWQFSGTLGAFVLSESRTNTDRTKSVRLHFFSQDLLRQLPGSPATLDAGWSEGTALVGRPNRRLLAPVRGALRVEVVRPMGDADPYTWRLYSLAARVPVTLAS